MLYIPKLKSIILAAAVIVGFTHFFVTSCFAENNTAKPGTFRIIFSNNMAGDYKPCG